jgi:hypothetical protein
MTNLLDLMTSFWFGYVKNVMNLFFGKLRSGRKQLSLTVPFETDENVCLTSRISSKTDIAHEAALQKKLEKGTRSKKICRETLKSIGV